jgi:hypothetical protein
MLEPKAQSDMTTIHESQFLNYLKATGVAIGARRHEKPIPLWLPPISTHIGNWLTLAWKWSRQSRRKCLSGLGVSEVCGIFSE